MSIATIGIWYAELENKMLIAALVYAFNVKINYIIQLFFAHIKLTLLHVQYHLEKSETVFLGF